MSTKKNNELKMQDTREEHLRQEAFDKESSAAPTRTGKRSAFNEDSDLATNPPGRKRDLSEPSTEEGDEDYDDEETEQNNYFEKAHYKNDDIEKLREDQKEFEGYGDEDFFDKP